MNFLDSFAEKHPKAAEWIRKGGLFLIFSWVVTALKAVMLMFLPSLFHGIVGDAEWLFPSIPVELFGVGFKLSIIGNALEVGADGAYLVNSGLAFTLANLTAIFFGECINFPLQRGVTFKSRGPLAPPGDRHPQDGADQQRETGCSHPSGGLGEGVCFQRGIDCY